MVNKGIRLFTISLCSSKDNYFFYPFVVCDIGRSRTFFLLRFFPNAFFPRALFSACTFFLSACFRCDFFQCAFFLEPKIRCFVINPIKVSEDNFMVLKNKKWIETCKIHTKIIDPIIFLRAISLLFPNKIIKN